MVTISGQCPGLFDFVNNSAHAMISSTKIGPICDTLTLEMDITTEAIGVDKVMENVTYDHQVKTHFCVHATVFICTTL